MFIKVFLLLLLERETGAVFSTPVSRSGTSRIGGMVLQSSVIRPVSPCKFKFFCVFCFVECRLVMLFAVILRFGGFCPACSSPPLGWSDHYPKKFHAHDITTSLCICLYTSGPIWRAVIPVLVIYQIMLCIARLGCLLVIRGRPSVGPSNCRTVFDGPSFHGTHFENLQSVQSSRREYVAQMLT